MHCADFCVIQLGCFPFVQRQKRNILLIMNAGTLSTLAGCNVTRFGDLLDFGQLFKAFETINLPKSLTFLDIFCVGVKIYHFSSEIIFGQLL